MSDELLAPETVLRSSPEEADRILARLERTVPVRSGLAELPAQGFAEALVIGDSHGDWRSTLEVRRAFLRSEGPPRMLVAMGDYVDRTPQDCRSGSVANALMLLDLEARFPDRVVLIQGNHETVSRIPVLPRTLPEEVDDLWGPRSERYDRIVALLERGPIAAVSPSGAFLSHAGFPRGPLPASWRRDFDRVSERRLIDVVWTECVESRLRRGLSEPWNGAELGQFLRSAQLSVFLRGHDPDLTGRVLYEAHCVTLHTTRYFERFGGVLLGHLPLDRPVRSIADVPIEHLPTEGHTYPPVV